MSTEIRIYYKADTVDEGMDMAIVSVMEGMFNQFSEKLDCMNSKLQVRYVGYLVDRRIKAKEVKDHLLLYTQKEVCIKVFYKTSEVDVLVDQVGTLESVTRKNTPKMYRELL